MGSLFQGHASEYFEGIRRKVIQEINRIPNSDIEQADADALAEQFQARYAADCPELGNDLSYDEPAFSGHSDRTIVSVYVPFTGTAALFQCSGGYAPILTEAIQVQDSQLMLQLPVERRSIDTFAGTVKALLGRIEEGFQSLRDYVRRANPQIKEQARQRIAERQTEIARHKNLLGGLQKSGFSLRRRNDGSEKVIVPVKAKPILLPSKSTPEMPEPELSLGDYDEILGVIRSMVAVFERSPSVFRTMEEEHLRTILLVALNGVFKGSATGETFNGSGKTDILIRVNDKNIFIAECLIWDGPEHFRKKLTEQLFRYATWRDSKLAALIFNRKKDFTAVMHKMKDVVTGLGNLAAELPFPDATGCRHQFRREDDPQKQFILTCHAFEVPS